MADADQMNDIKRTRYELTFLARTSEDGAKIPSVASRHGAEVTFASPVNQIQLAYPIKKEVSAYFGFIQFAVPGAEAVKMSEELNREPSILRFLLVEAPSEQPQAEKPAATAPTGEAPTPTAKPATTSRAGITTNEALEKRLEEILN